MVTIFCECYSWEGCNKQITLPKDVVEKKFKDGLTLIVDDCPIGPSTGDIFREKGEGYKLFKESK